MPRGTVTVMDVPMNGGTVASAWTIDTTNGAYIPNDGNWTRLFLQIKQTGGTAGTVNVVPGVNPPAFRSGMGGTALNGTLQVVVPATSGERFVVLESARFAQADQSIYLDFSASCVGTVSAYRLPAEMD